MFAGITSLTNEQNGDVITGMNSREGESVKFDVSVKISDDPKINIWLTKVQDQMRLSLAKNLESAVKEISLLSESNEEGKTEKLLHEIEVYAAQVVLLSMQVVWSNKVEKGLGASPGMQEVVDYTLTNLSILAERVLVDLKKDIRQKYEQLITEFVH
jgi:dynein heavy chain 1